MEQSHREQIAKDRRNGLLRAGIGAGYHKRKLAEAGESGSRLSTWLAGPAANDVRKHGQGWTIYGPGAASYDVTMLLSRGLFIEGIYPKVVPLWRLVTAIERNPEELEAVEKAEVLVVTNFVQSYADGTCPLRGSQIMAVEEFLGERIDNLRSIVLHADRRLVPSEGMWWSEALLQRVAKSNAELAVGGYRS